MSTIFVASSTKFVVRFFWSAFGSVAASSVEDHGYDHDHGPGTVITVTTTTTIRLTTTKSTTVFVWSVYGIFCAIFVILFVCFFLPAQREVLSFLLTPLPHTHDDDESYQSRDFSIKHIPGTQQTETPQPRAKSIPYCTRTHRNPTVASSGRCLRKTPAT